ncbi:thiosulfate oxidation carrier complex protein SoxZ [Methylobacillus flagellatus]|uniref:thiosulfate oxidation carrier complex protein SoxZ n=1 Tax=Methylobacillus flagellatus TaxID=405 RepID=UPI0028686ED2|nr:thiosulfate oxidation carrier complex protein SoxZ [Methylobacillus flagellatus]
MTSAANSTGMRARLRHGVAEVTLSLLHPMENGHRLDGSGQAVSAHFIQLVQVSHNGQQVLEAQWGTGIASDPQLIFYVADAKAGDTVSVEWHDNKGHSGRHAITLA